MSLCIKILYLDDEPTNLKLFKAMYRREGWQIFTTNKINEAREILKNENINIILSDERMPETTGIEFFESILKEHPNQIRILTTAYTDVNCLIDAINKGQIYKYVEKPWRHECLKTTIIQAYELFVLRQHNNKLLIDLQNYNKELLKINKQLEFMLHQKTSFGSKKD